MTTLSELRAALRVVLNDGTAGAYLWSDGALNRHLSDAVGAYGRYFPREMTTTLTTVAGQAEYGLPAGCERVVRVEGPNPRPLPESGREEDDVLVHGGDSFGVGYRVFGGRLVLMPEPQESGRTVRVEYLGAHAGLTEDVDVSTVPAGDEDLVVALAAAGALERLANDEAKRGRYESRAGEAADKASAVYMERWSEGVRERKRGLRVSQLVVR